MAYDSKYEYLETLKKLRDIVSFSLGGPTSGCFELIFKSVLVGIVPAAALFFIPLWVKAPSAYGWLFAGFALVVAFVLGIWHWRHYWPTVRAEVYECSRELNSDWVRLWFGGKHAPFILEKLSFSARWAASSDWKVTYRQQDSEKAHDTLWLSIPVVQVLPVPECASNDLYPYGLKLVVQHGENMFLWCRDKDERRALLDVFRVGGCEILPSS